MVPGTDIPRRRVARTPTAPRSIKLAHLQSLLGDEEDDDTRRKATVTLSAMIGALMIARALGPTTRSDEILRDVREAVRGSHDSW